MPRRQVHGSDLLIRPKQCCSPKPDLAKAVVPTTDSEPSDPILLGTEVRMAYRPILVQRMSDRPHCRLRFSACPRPEAAPLRYPSNGRQVRCVAPGRMPERHAGCEHDRQPEIELHSFGPLTTGFEWVCTDSSWPWPGYSWARTVEAQEQRQLVLGH